MNTNQIKCFLAVAETLNFTKAASQLYMTQPGLSRYIVSLERELNTLLFIRDQQKVRLTPAGAVLAQELDGFLGRLEDLINKVQKVGQGYNGTLVIGTLGGQWMGDDFTDLYLRFMSAHPNIDMIFKQGSFRDLRQWLGDGEIDLALTLAFDVHHVPDILYETCDDDYPVLAVSKRSRLGQQDSITLQDVARETFIIISPEDSRAGYELCHLFLKNAGLRVSNIRYAPNLATVMMWIESAQGVGIINHRSSIASNSSIRILEELEIEKKGSANAFAWHRSNLNPAISLFLDQMKQRAEDSVL